MLNTILLCLALALPGPQESRLEDEQLLPLSQSLAAYFEAQDAALGVEGARADLGRSLADLSELLGDAPPLAATLELGRALRLSRRARVEARPGKVLEESFRGGSFAAAGLAFAYRTPKVLSADSGGWPLIISLPDQDEEPAAHIRARWTSPGVRDGALVLCPAMPVERGDWTQVMVRGRPGGLSHVVTALRLAGERFPIDPDRIYIVGHGRSVPVAVAVGNFSPHRFAGIIGRAGDVGDGAEQVPDNFGNLPTFFTGAGPQATRFEAAARAAERAPCTLQQDGGEADIWSWINDHTRAALPGSVDLTVGQPFPTRISWLRVSPSAPDAQLSGTLDRAANSVHLAGHGVSHATLYLNDELLDLDRPVRIFGNGVEHTFFVARSLGTTLSLIQDGTSDPGCVYVAQVVLDLSAESPAADAAAATGLGGEFTARLEATGETAAALLELRAEYLDGGLQREAAAVLQRALRLHPEEPAVRAVAGHVLEDGHWFSSGERRARYIASQDQALAEAKGHVRHKQAWMHPDDKSRAAKGWRRDPDTGLWETPDDRRLRERGWVRQDLEWIAPEQAAQTDAGRWRVDGEWLDLPLANQRHAGLDSMWRIPSPDVLLYSTASRATSSAALVHMARAMGDLRRVFGLEPTLPLSVALLRSEEQVDRFALGEPDGRRYPTHAGRTHVIQGGFFAERWFERAEGKLVFRGMGVGLWDALVPNGDAFGVHSARLALGLSYVDAVDPSPKAVRAALARGPGLDYTADWRKEKRLPGWLRWGAAVYAERFFRDEHASAGSDPWWARTWSLESLAGRGGLRPLEQVLAFELDPDEREDAQRLLLEAGLLVAFMLDGDNAPVREAHEELKRALVRGRLHARHVTALEEALLAEASALRDFAGS